MKIKEILIISLIVALFILFSYFVREYSEFLEYFISLGYFKGMFIYVLITIISIVFAPITTLPILPVASALWGGFIAGILSVFGWIIGAVIAFYLARRFGHPYVRKVANFKKIEEIEHIIPENNIFWSLVFMRLVIPVDILSYGIGIFTNIKFKTYIFATIIGIMPFAFIFSYVAVLPIKYQIVGGVFVIILLFFGYERIKKNYIKLKNK